MTKERAPVPFDRYHFRKLKEKGSDLSMGQIFTQIYESNHWSGGVSISGEGSDHEQTRILQRVLPELIKQFDICSLLDLPCGDFNWMKDVDMGECRYTGADIVEEIVQTNNDLYGNDGREFVVCDITKDPLLDADIILSRDCLVHLSNSDALKALDNIRDSAIQYLFTTTFTDCHINEDIETGDWRIINLQRRPFNLPEPLLIINEGCTEGGGTYGDKSLGLWEVKFL